MSCAWLTSSATLGLASKLCGSVFGLLRIDDTWTYAPPICASTSAYSFSAPTALITPGLEKLADEVPQALSSAHNATRVGTTVTSSGTRGCRQRTMSTEYRETGSHYQHLLGDARSRGIAGSG